MDNNFKISYGKNDKISQPKPRIAFRMDLEFQQTIGFAFASSSTGIYDWPRA